MFQQTRMLSQKCSPSKPKSHSSEPKKRRLWNSHLKAPPFSFQNKFRSVLPIPWRIWVLHPKSVMGRDRTISRRDTSPWTILFQILLQEVFKRDSRVLLKLLGLAAWSAGKKREYRGERSPSQSEKDSHGSDCIDHHSPKFWWVFLHVWDLLYNMWHTKVLEQTSVTLSLCKNTIWTNQNFLNSLA